jgi:hypothetical protein
VGIEDDIEAERRRLAQAGADSRAWARSVFAKDDHVPHAPGPGWDVVLPDVIPAIPDSMWSICHIGTAPDGTERVVLRELKRKERRGLRRVRRFSWARSIDPEDPGGLFNVGFLDDGRVLYAQGDSGRFREEIVARIAKTRS